MKKQIYEKNYDNQDLTIPASIWNDNNVKGLQKPLLALYKKMTRDGQQKLQCMTIRQAQILATHEKDIKYNIKELVKRGFIKLSKEDGKLWIEYTYKVKPVQKTQDAAGLF